MFRKEELVKINGILVSKNGFKNLTFETSKFSNMVTPLRGFGSSLDENNLNVIDTLNLEFYVDAEELRNIAFIYTQFRVLGALPIENEYILKKVKDSLLVERSYTLFKNKEKLKKKITHLIVFLENIQIRSLERTNNGYSVYMKLSLHKNAFDVIEYDNFKNFYKEWESNKNVNFKENCLNYINHQIDKIKTPGELIINVYNIEKLNAKFKTKAFLLSDVVDNINESDAKDKENRLELLYKYSDLDSHYNLSIPEVHVAQIEMITQNLISNTPIKGQSIGMKSFLGIGPTFYNVKMIFDEKDNHLLSELKKISDNNIANHKIEIIHPLMNMFDFHSAVIKNMIFNNVEGSNGVIVTIQFQINGYNFFDKDKLNIGSIGSVEKIDESNMGLDLTGSYMETCIEDIFNNKKYYLNEKREIFAEEFDEQINGRLKDVNVMRQNKDIKDERYFTRFSFLLSTIIETTKNVRYNYAKFGDFLSMYSSAITSFATISRTNGLNNKKYSIYKDFDNLSDKMSGFYNEITQRLNSIDLKNNFFSLDNFLFPSREFGFDKISGIYNYIDYVSLATLSENPYVKEKFNSKEEYKVFKKVEENLFTDLSNYIFSNTISGEPNVEAITDMSINLEMYRKLYIALNNGVFSHLVEELKNDESIQNADSTINFERVHYYISRFIGEFFKQIKKISMDYKFAEVIIKRIKSVDLGREHLYSSTKELEKIVMNRMETVLKSFEILEKSVKQETCDLSYNIFLSKILYTLIELIEVQDVKTEELFYIDKYLKSMIIASACFGFLTVKIKSRTDNFGNVYKASCYKISNALRVLLSTGKHIDDNEKEHTFFGSNYKYLVNNSYWNKKINWDNFSSTKVVPISEDLKSSEINKDFNFIYGKKIKNYFPEKILSKALRTIYDDESEYTCEEFLQKAKNDYINNNFKSLEWHQLNKVSRKSPILGLPSFNSVMREHTSKGDFVSPIMKKRIIGSKDVFSDLEKVSNIINTEVVETIPDYEIVIKSKKYENENAGIYKILKLSSTIGINNIINLSITKNSDSKIKIAEVTIVDMNKEIIDYFNQNTFGVLNNDSGIVDIIMIEPGNEIEIYLGFSDNKHLVYKGFISKLAYSNNLFNIKCVDSTAELYSYKFPEIKFKDLSLIDTAKDELIKMTTSGKGDGLTEGIKNTIVSKISTPNDHLFNVVDYSNSKNNLLITPFKDGEMASFYNAFLTSLFKMPYSITKNFEPNNYISDKDNILIQSITEYVDLHSAFTTFGKNKSAAATTSFSNSFTINVNNVDADYDTYGVEICLNDEALSQQTVSFEEYEQMKKNIKNKSKESKYLEDSVTDYKYNKEKHNLNQDIKSNNDFSHKVDEVQKAYEEDKKMENIAKTESENNQDNYAKEKLKNKNTLSVSDLCEIIKSPTDCKTITSIYGEARKRKKNGVSTIGRHYGIDIVADANGGKNIYAPISGKLKVSKKTGYGNTIELFNSDYNIKFLFAHLLKNDTSLDGKEVSQGEKIGIIGNSGTSTGEHLHLECSINGERIDPLDVLGLWNYKYYWHLIGQTAKKLGNVYSKEILDYKLKVNNSKKEFLAKKDRVEGDKLV